MTPRLRLVVGTLVLFCAVAIGAPDGPEGPAEKSAYPLFEEDGQWWAGIGDVCEIVGAEFEGGGFTQAIEQEDGKLRIQMRVVFGHAGPLKITVGEDTYEIEVGREQIDKNGENYRDFIHTPKRVKGVACATLEDLSGLLGFVVGEPDDGQPTIVADEGPIRLVEGERPIP
ncbi:MAG TPA: hypothetical protein QGH10_00600, partial [Armatimonadota bacterium]|nr:hypothetical protein [Armatimonadota bacterium]